MTISALRTLTGPLALAAVVTALAGCGVGDIDRTQPNKVEKSIFKNADGSPKEYFYRQTVIDVPATHGVTFIGYQNETERVIFDVTENFLFVYRSYGWLQNDSENGTVGGNQGDGYVRPGTGAYQGAPLAAFAIQSHFDVQRQYNAMTGEQTNVIAENTQDRPWYEREYMRVDWANNQVTDMRFDTATALAQPASFYIPEEDGSGSNKDRPVITEDYVDVVTAMNVTPEFEDFTAWGYGKIPKCYFYNSIYKDCVGGTIKMRQSFVPVDKLPMYAEGGAVGGKSDYVALDYDDNRFAKFGFFRTERFRYVDEYGTVEPAQLRMANRWNLWNNAQDCYDPTAALPYASCSPSQLRTIVYYLNEDYPTEPAALREMALNNADEWNRVFRNAVKAATGWSDADLGDHRMFTICANNPVRQGDPAECGPVGTNPQMGDLRYSMYYYIPNVQDSPPLGYGPSAADPFTGEIIQGNAFYYGAPGATIAARTRDIIELELGITQVEDIIDGLPAQQVVSSARAAASSSRNARSQRLGRDVSERAKNLASNLKIKQKAQRLKTQIQSGQAFIDRRNERKAALKSSGLVAGALTDEVREVFAGHMLAQGLDPSNMDTEMAARLLDDDMLFSRRDERLERMLTPEARGCILMAEDVFDDGLLGIIATVKNRFYDLTVSPPQLKANFTRDDVYNFLLANTMGDTQLHEIGHTVGLRHNFSGSTDALNFGPDYWELRGLALNNATQRPIPEWELSGGNLQAHSAALDLGLRDVQDSSVMDYASTYGTNTKLGTYDEAAIKYAYGDVVEIFNAPSVTPERAALLRAGEVHYTRIPEIISDADDFALRVEDMYDRGNLNFRQVKKLRDAVAGDPIEVPYSFCSDEYRDASATCAIWDQGADNFERTSYTAEKFRNYAVFNQFKRERLTWGIDVFSYLSRTYRTDMTYMLNQYKNWVNDELIVRDGRPCLVVENGQVVTESADRFVSDSCGLAGFLGTVEAVNILTEVLERPDVGCYVRLQPGCYDTVAGNANVGFPPDDGDITLVSANPDACDTHVPVQPLPDSNDPARVALKVTAESPYAHVRDSVSCEGFNAPGNLADFLEPIVEMPFAVDGARPANTLYDRDRYGYYFYIKPIVIGSWWDKWLAVKAFGDADTDFIGVDASSDARSFLINLNTLFGDDIQDLIGATITGNASKYAAGLDLDSPTKIAYVPLLSLTTGGRESRAGVVPVDPDQQYTFRLLALYNAAYQGQYTDNYEFGESIAVGKALSVTDIDVPAAIRNNPARYAEVTDPVTGIKWYALNQLRGGGEDPFYSVAYNYIREIKDQYYVGGADGPGTQVKDSFEGQFDFMPRQDIEILQIMWQTSRVFGHADVWSGDLGI